VVFNRSLAAKCSNFSFIIILIKLDGRLKKTFSARLSSHANELGRSDYQVPGRAAQILLRPIYSAIRQAKKKDDADNQPGQLGSCVLFPLGNHQIPQHVSESQYSFARRGL